MNRSDHRRRETAIPALACGLFALACCLAAQARADAVTQWSAIMEQTIDRSDPYTRLRTATITQLAVFEAVNSIIGDYQPYARKIDAPAGASPQAAAIAAAHGTLAALHPDRQAELAAARAAALAEILDGSAKRDGIAVGEAAAAAMVALRENDGSDAPVPYEPGNSPGRWLPTPPAFAPAFGPQIGAVTPFAIGDVARFRIGPPPALRSAHFARDYREVQRVGDVNSSARSQDRTDVAHFYALTEPVEIYHPATRQVSEAQARTLSQNARTFALMSMAIFDAAVAVFDAKYYYDFWRPVTAIRAGDTDRNRRTDPDPQWMPLVETPPFPSYPSGHAGFAGAVRRVLECELGKDGFALVLRNPRLPEVVLHYTSWKQITDDIDDGRIYGGVHYRFDQEAAARLGRRVGSDILRRQLRALRTHGDQASPRPGEQPGGGEESGRRLPDSGAHQGCSSSRKTG